MAAIVEVASFRGMSMLVTRPEYDSGTRYLAAWASLVVQEAKTRGKPVYDLLGTQANRREVESRVQKLQPDFLFLNGHGTTRSVFGQDDVPLIVAGENDEVLHGRITYVVACASASELGVVVSRASQSAYIGYDRKFGIVRHHGYLNRPLDDPYARPMQEVSNQIPIALLKGHSCREAVERAKAVGERHLQRIQSSIADPDTLQIVQTLWWNMRHLVCKGDATRTL